MTSRLDHTIVIPSSPEQNWARSVSPCTPTRLFGLPPMSISPPSLPSPSRLFEEIGLGQQKNPPSPKSPFSSAAGKTATSKAITENPSRNESSSKRGRPGSSEAKTAGSRKNSKSQETRNKILTGRVAKPTTVSKAKATAASKSKDTSVVKAKAGTKKSKPASQNKKDKLAEEAEAEAKEVADAEGLNLEEALKRRSDWTPPKALSLVSIDEDTPSQGSGTKLSFGDVLRDYHYNRENSSCEPAQPSKEGNPTKRRRLELVEFEVLQERKPIQQKQIKDAVKTRKTKSKPKKQLNTITARVTARYEQIGELEDLFVYNEESSCETSECLKKPTKPKKETAGKQKEPEYIILSPDAATKSLNDQNFLFGTCSQLERDDSPTFFEETQTAIQLSECLTFKKTASTITTASSAMSIATRFTGKKSHWSEAARDFNGAVVQPEIIDMTDSPTVSVALSRLSEVKHDAPKMASLVSSQSVSATNSLVPKDVVTASKPAADVQLASSGPEPNKTELAAGPFRKTASRLPEMPNFNGYTDSELKNQVLSYGFSLRAVRGRKKMIELLDKCWQSKHGNTATAAIVETSSSAAINETVSVSAARHSDTQVSDKLPTRKKKTTPSRLEPKTTSRAGKKKVSEKPLAGKADKPVEKAASPIPASTYNMVDEIEDSEEEIIPSPTRIQIQRQSSSRQTTPAISCLPLGTKSKRSLKSTKSSTYDEATLLELQSSITKAIHLQTRPRRSLGGSSYSPQLTWHEKILLYEPIILEDFAAWLNTEGFALACEDREVGVALVRTWCESRGICCTFRP
ncbi:conserved hypothetical protein [Talaromyces stipitatus ATCC 10500]|uniref:Structure-specific endonuclease subunit slx4 n=1 Tax=Talaromyces stipitatus (strain ATCC 10500 / CBS 375.48 / QM 6759 / NRRL 1006) TaxID=441959 RepID=SLX4_TALSN|nr:uncharacterized protein TSTA_016430 [Talaromyces stipitatus ATCC 10500]B8MED8.1 RecName: Full=Structure-specific endonuclease subunit slx4 [Talaromyces stipitatus ATCC 10500]EED16565.1 conserved hypothetical protein [Talaromyces stipitatus ATCC 10500]